ncbi:hypothetical protein SAMN00120144_2671 [Hymenobacter roseosalivarius DSM 11622]|uniref:Uncharacterized protein n=1 Tax=Hymenobacter roseosalivarius DSM 11622 TaxID=645990 RepID=A0A1W1VJZ1_9BACT|nr:hypothetical protein [Hymenobacter roseosalivarius]SMB93648.1 hypothetical protein SAMN00120144_2671 [Hymenobacter roseosalivarius DSM 11622]
MSLLPKLTLFGAFTLLLLGTTELAQAQVDININSPSWGPAAPAGTQYYYIPEVGGYYDLRDRQYVVQREGKWKRVATLSNYNPNNFHPVVINYMGAQPWVLIREHKVKYPKHMGHPHGMPPGQAKKMRSVYPAGNVIVVQQGDGHPGKGHGNGHSKGKGKY